MGDVDEAGFHYSLISLAEQRQSCSTRYGIEWFWTTGTQKTSKGASRGHKMIENKTKQSLK